MVAARIIAACFVVMGVAASVTGVVHDDHDVLSMQFDGLLAEMQLSRLKKR